MNIFQKIKKLKEIQKRKKLDHRIREIDVMRNIISLEPFMATSAKFEHTEKGKEKFAVAEAMLNAVITGSFMELSSSFFPNDFVDQARDSERINKELTERMNK